MKKRNPRRHGAGNKQNRHPSAKKEAPPQKLRASVLREVARRPLDAAGLAAALDLPPAWRPKLQSLLADMERCGDIARIRKDRYIVPKEADLFTGTIQFHANGSAHVLSEKAGGRDLLIRGENTLTAMHGDRVVARIGAPPPEPGFFRGPERQPEGRVIRILERANETIVGTLQRSKNFFYVVCDDPRFVHNLYVKPPAPPLPAKPGDKVVAKLEAWPSRHVNPEGRIIEVLGAADAPGVDMLSIIRRHRLPLEFPADVRRDAERTPPEVSPHDASSREDLRGAFVFTIDPDDARDFDDAVNIERTPAGWRVGIHIADVSHYVKPGTPLDREAVARGNSTYLADRVIPMLPEALSNGVCSLKPHVDRLAFSVFAEVSEKGKILSARFAKTVIRSAARLTYREALAILKKPPGPDTLSQSVHTAWELSSTLRKKRFAAGSLELDFPEIKVWLDKNGRPERLERVENDISHQLIEELMLLANELVARELKHRRQPALYRIHENPDPDRLEEFREFALTQGVRAGDLTQRAEIVKILAAIRGKPFAPAVRIALLKSLKRARYFPEPVGHYGLAKPDYTHFTSPIRRYSDLVVHRALERRLGLTKKGPESTELAALSDHISATERTSAEAEKESVRLKKLEYFQLQLKTDRPQRFEALVIDVRNFGAFVELPEFLLTGLVHISSLEGDFYVHDAARARLVARRSKKTIALGDKIQVAVARVDMFKQQVDFKPA
ncbi:MAG: ribonuclease R [Verrucomicrobia bacterium]|jgi:ribonuclease R|nr:ribonuclease R [Verrucomicrobiota bacterium]